MVAGDVSGLSFASASLVLEIKESSGICLPPTFESVVSFVITAAVAVAVAAVLVVAAIFPWSR